MTLELILGGAVAALVAVVTAFFKGKNAGRKEVERDAYQDTIDRINKGRDAVRDGRGRDPADRLRDNDQNW